MVILFLLSVIIYTMKEYELYNPIKQYLEDLGYLVKAEVNDVDIVAKKDDQVIAIEMKKTLSLKHLYQGCIRQKMIEDVYLAILKPNNTKDLKEKLHILHRLNLGLMLLDIKKQSVEVVLDPKPFTMRKNYKKKNLLMNEFNQRQLNNNIAGVSKTKIMTAYREEAITIAKTLLDGPLSTKDIRGLTHIKKTTSILYKNFYGWFEPVDRGIYKLTDQGRVELLSYLIGGKLWTYLKF